MTTVGYGDFGAQGYGEITITCIWIFFGVGFYTVVVGSLTSYIVQQGSINEDLVLRLKALDQFRKEADLENELYHLIRKFLMNNYDELN